MRRQSHSDQYVKDLMGMAPDIEAARPPRFRDPSLAQKET